MHVFFPVLCIWTVAVVQSDVTLTLGIRVPYGWVAIPVSSHLIRPKDTEDPPSSAEVVDTAFMFACNVWVPEWAKKMEAGAWSGVVALNRSHFERNKGKQLWVDRSTVFEKFVKAVEKM